MKFEDILALAKQGYKPADIKELLAIEPKEEEPKEEPKDEPKEEPKEEPKKEPKEEPDYKKLYEESQEALKRAQQKNTHQDASGKEDEKTDSEILMDFAKSFM